MTPRRRPSPPRRRHRYGGGFTLIELLVVIGIIVLLAAILMPVVSSVRKAAYQTSTEQQMQRILQACEMYYHDNNAYPGPVANVYLIGGSRQGMDTGTLNFRPTGVTGGPSNNAITSSENLVLGLFGFLDPPTASTGAGANRPIYNNGGVTPKTNPAGPPPHEVLSLANLTLRPNPRTYHYIDYVPDELSTGQAKTLDSQSASNPKDTNVPEFVDRFPDKMPFLYARANVGNPGVATTNDTMQYNINLFGAYGCNIQLNNGSGKPTLVDAAYITNLNNYTSGSPTLADDVQTPFQDWDGSGSKHDGWLSNPNIQGSARGKDGFVLIAAGKDRVYGTHDDTIITP